MTSDSQSTRLQALYHEYGQSPWLDNLTRPILEDGTLQHLIDQGVRGLTSNPTIFQKAIESTTTYARQYSELQRAGRSQEDALWELILADITSALKLFRPVYDSSNGGDGFASVEVSPLLAKDTDRTVTAARELWIKINQPNVMIKIPATEAGLEAIKTMTSEGCNINVTLIFGLPRYAQVIEAYLSGLEGQPGDLSHIHSVASFFISRTDTLVDPQLVKIGTPAALALCGKVAIAQAVLAYEIFEQSFSGPRWQRLADRGANVQRPLWASTSVKNPEYPELLYVESLIAPQTVNTLPGETIAAFADHGRTDQSKMNASGRQAAQQTLAALREVGLDIDQVGQQLEVEGVEKFTQSYQELLEALDHPKT